MIAPSAQPSRRWTAADSTATLFLLATGLVVAWPMLHGAGLYYLDNPVHLAELHALATEGSWSEAGFAGFPVRALHSPLWYGLIAALGRVGGSIDAGYAALTWLGTCAASLAVFAVGRRRLPVPVAAGLGWLVLVQHPSIVGIGAATGGMGTFHLASGLAVWLLGEVIDARRWRLHRIAAACGVLFLTHVFVLPIVGLVLVIGVVQRRDGWGRRLGIGTAALVLGLAAAAIYLLPLVATTHFASLPGHLRPTLPQQHLRPLELAAALVAPIDFALLRDGTAMASTLPFRLDAIPMVTLILLGLFGGWRAWTRPDGDLLARAGLVLAAMVTLLLLVAGTTGLSVFGPLSWRDVHFIRLGLAVAACGAWPRGRWIAVKPSASAGLAALGLALAAVLATPLRVDAATEGQGELREVRALWSWLRTHQSPTWGRVYVQDTTFTPEWPKLSRSHVMALTRRESGVRVVGAYYGIVPFVTGRISQGEAGAITGVFPDAENATLVFMRLAELGATHVVTVTRAARNLLLRDPRYHAEAFLGRIAVFTIGDGTAHWIEHGTKVRQASARWVGPGALDIDVDVAMDAARVRVSMASDADHRLQGPAGAALETSHDGLVLIRDLPEGHHRLAIRHVPWRVPVWISGIAWAFLLALALRTKLRPVSEDDTRADSL